MNMRRKMKEIDDVIVQATQRIRELTYERDGLVLIKDGLKLHIRMMDIIITKALAIRMKSDESPEYQRGWNDCHLAHSSLLEKP